MKQKIIGLLLIFSTVLKFNTQAQNLMGYSISNYSGTQGLYLNPASIADSRHLFYMNLGAMDLSVRNDYMGYDGKVPILKAIKDTAFDWNSHLIKYQNGKPHKMSFENENRGLSAMFSWNEKNSIAFCSRLRMFIQAYNVSEDLIKSLEGGWSNSATNYYNYLNSNSNHFKLNVNMMSEWSLSYGRIVYDKKQHFVKAGLTIKRDRGLLMVQLENKSLEFKMASNDSIAVYHVDAGITYTSEKYFGITDFTNTSQVLDKPVDRMKKWLFGSEKLGAGWGMDIGAEYEYRPQRKYYYTMDCKQSRNPMVNKYKYRLGFSINDWGHVTYKGDNIQNVHINLDPTTLNYDTVKWGEIDTIKHVKSTADVVSLIKKVAGSAATSNPTTFKSKLPTNITITGDYKIKEHIYVSGMMVMGVRRKIDLDGSRFSGLISVAPRIEYKWFDASIPLVFRPGWGSTELGLSMRLGPAFIGTTNFGSIIGIGQIKGANFFFGLCIPIAKKLKKDKDGDKVSDKMDKCPKEKGTCETEGCPDKDGDGIIDKDDKCPDIPGVIKFKGCADTDGDGVMDSLDQCPDVPGIKRLKGCPDTDKDGVPDKEDECPDAAGDKKLNGCPDTDKDGISDKKDRCPTKAGAADMQGCPDRDKDGVADIDDLCPDVKGPKESYGCPDTDGDGITDNEDKCKKAKGTKENHGCPEKKLTDAEQHIVDKVFSNLEFETAKATIIAASFNSLDSLADLLVKAPTYRLMISGYTDNVGAKENNKKLSEERAFAVRDYLITKGVAESRLNAFGYGESNPIADNETPEGRAKNRRVEFEILK
jgi:outer membrane protein OmpA-like peptidoglycan-associated protein